MTYKVVILRPALKRLKNLSKPERDRMRERIRGLAGNPYPADCKPLGDGFFPLREGDYRAIYKIQGEAGIVVVVLVGDRKSIYQEYQRELRRLLQA
ncbi:MAG: type II toxin-antitoxin system RelE/ParE family toxin [Candidatus Sumerlaeota bacterium]|nr:type II toxin-antitoxin system RelE/ParE family toxin [Candidatus Sumerlaeota bacterium]